MGTKKSKRPNQQSFKLDEDTRKRLSEFCAKRGLKKAYIIEQAIKNYLTMQES